MQKGHVTTEHKGMWLWKRKPAARKPRNENKLTNSSQL